MSVAKHARWVQQLTTSQLPKRATERQSQCKYMLGKLLGADAASVISAPEANLDLTVV